MKKKRKFRHSVSFFFVEPVLWVYFRIAYSFKAKRYKPPKGEKGPYLVIANHSTAHDAFFMAFGFPGVLYYVASDMLFSVKYWSKIMTYLVDPIAKTKYRSDIETIRDMKRVVKEGGSIGLFPEGNTTFSGALMPTPFVIAKLIKKLKIPVLFYQIKGGYLARPRWSRTKRKGPVTGHMAKVLYPEEFEKMSPDAIYEVIKANIYVDEYSDTARYKSKYKAEDIESAYFICPTCGALESLHSKGNDVWCMHCEFHARMNEYGRFETLAGKGFETTVPWYDYQQVVLEAWLETQKDDTILFENSNEKILEVKRSKYKTYKAHGSIRLYKTHVVFSFNDGRKEKWNVSNISSAVQQKNKLILHNEKEAKTYYLRSHPKRNALKYVLAIEWLKTKERD